MQEFTKDNAWYQRIRFLAIAADKRERDFLRRAINFIKVENGIGYATDGHRLHRADVCLDDGYYLVDKLTKTKVVLTYCTSFTNSFEWPYVNGLINTDYGAAVTVHLLDTDSKELSFRDESVNLSRIYKAMGDEVLSYKYINDATLGNEMKALILGENSPVKLEGENGNTAWIMPAWGG